jgi:hypothetical protein
VPDDHVPTRDVAYFDGEGRETGQPGGAEALVAFLRARLDERETRATAADAVQADPARVADLAGDDAADTVGILNRAAVAAHITDSDPQFVLADIAAKRQIIDAHQSLWQDEPPEHLGPGCKTCSGEVEGWPCTTLRLLALPYAGHPDYREDFRPGGPDLDAAARSALRPLDREEQREIHVATAEYDEAKRRERRQREEEQHP